MATEKDKIWFEQNSVKLEEKYKGQYIAILNEKVVANSDNFDEVTNKLMELSNSGGLGGTPLIVRAVKKNTT